MVPAACMVPHLPWTPPVALGKSLGFPGPQLPAIVKGGWGHRYVTREVGWGSKVSKICSTRSE